MPDITMCENRECPLRETCYRFKAEPSKWRQSYFVDMKPKDGKCDYYWKIESGEGNVDG
jgi:hypothetical protein